MFSLSFFFFLFWCRILGGVGDEQRSFWICRVRLHDRPSSWPATPPSGWWRGGDGRGSGARPFIVLNPQWRHGEDPPGRPARVEPQQLVLRQVGWEESVCTQQPLRSEVTCWSVNSLMLVEPWGPIFLRENWKTLGGANVIQVFDLFASEQWPGIKQYCVIKLSLQLRLLAFHPCNTRHKAIGEKF